MSMVPSLELPDFLARANARERSQPRGEDRTRFVLDIARETVAARVGEDTAAV